MPDENSGNNATEGTPSDPSSVDNKPVGSNGTTDPDQEIDNPKTLAQDVHWITRATFWSQVALGIIGMFALWIYHGQLDEMRKATTDNTEALRLAQDSFEISDGNFDRTMHQTIRQTVAELRAAAAAKSASEVATESLQTSERAYISTGAPFFNWQAKAFFVPLENKGHIPSGPVKIIVFESTTITTPHPPEVPSFYTYACWHRVKVDTLDTGPSPVSISAGARYFDADKIRNGLESFQIATDISYNDGFLRTPVRHWKSCTVTTFQNGAILSNPCFLAHQTEQIMKLSGYPNVTKTCSNYPDQ